MPSSTSNLFKWRQFRPEIILLNVRWYLAYNLSTRNLEEMMAERGVSVDHSTINRWVIRYSPMLEARARRCKRPVGRSWKLDETFIKVKGQSRYLYRAVDKAGNTVDFLLTAKRDWKAAQRFLRDAIGSSGRPRTINIDGSAANNAGINGYNQATGSTIAIRQCRYLNNILEQDHRRVKRRVRVMLGFKSFRSARAILAGIELVHMIRKGQVRPANENDITFAGQFDALAA